jgi:Putative  PD-(D/E)XK family member, (DUF4420)
MIAPDRHLEWRNFRQVIDEGVPAVLPVSGTPPVTVFVDQDGRRIGLHTPAEDAVVPPASPLADIDVQVVTVDGRRYLEVSTSARRLFVEFYALLEELADRIQLKSVEPARALAETVANWKALLRPAERLSEDEQLGLLGELWVLERLVRVLGPAAVSAWTGPLSEPHDFRLGEVEVEVKSTLGVHRRHWINGSSQLEPTPGLTLHILSLQFEPAGAANAMTLPDQVQKVRALLGGTPSQLELFDRGLLLGWRYADEDASDYQAGRCLRSLPALIPVNATLPRITEGLVRDRFGSDAGRVDEVRYRLDVDGLGVLDGTPAFLDVLPQDRQPTEKR